MELEEENGNGSVDRSGDENFGAAMDSIADYFASVSHDGPTLTDDAREINPSVLWNDPENFCIDFDRGTIGNASVDEDIFAHPDSMGSQAKSKDADPFRFIAKTSALNSLAMRSLLHQENEDMPRIEKINCNGTWDSIVAFG